MCMMKDLGPASALSLLETVDKVFSWDFCQHCILVASLESQHRYTKFRAESCCRVVDPFSLSLRCDFCQVSGAHHAGETRRMSVVNQVSQHLIPGEEKPVRILNK